MGTRHYWIFLISFTGFSTILFLVTVLVAQIETYVPGRRSRSEPAELEHESQQRHHDEPTAA